MRSPSSSTDKISIGATGGNIAGLAYRLRPDLLRTPSANMSFRRLRKAARSSPLILKARAMSRRIADPSFVAMKASIFF